MLASGLALLLGLAACGTRSDSRSLATQRISQMGLDRYLQQAVGQSNEGVVLLSTERSPWELDRARLNEIAQNMRQPLALCFLDRAIVSMKPGKVDGEDGWVNVPDGQARIRARLTPEGKVMRAEVLASAFEDDAMEQCVIKVVEKTRFPEVRRNAQTWIDVVYWVTLGFDSGAQSPAFQEDMRRQQALAASRATRCFEGRAKPGRYTATGLNLVDREGVTLVNRVDSEGLPAPVASCVAQALKGIVVPPDREAFLRPIAPAVSFEVTAQGEVRYGDQEWFELVQLEERAEAEERRRELGYYADDDASAEATAGAGDAEVTVSGVGPAVDDAGAKSSKPDDEHREGPRDPKGGVVSATDDGNQGKPGENKPGSTKTNPSASGIKLNLGSRDGSRDGTK